MTWAWVTEVPGHQDPAQDLATEALTEEKRRWLVAAAERYSRTPGSGYGRLGPGGPPGEFREALAAQLRKDRRWFREHPDLGQVIRPYLKGEFPGAESIPDVVSVLVIGTPAVSRTRIPLITPDTSATDPAVGWEGLDAMEREP